MTLAVAKSLMDGYGKTDEEITEILIANMKKYGRIFPDAGYGGMFYQWLMTGETKPYNSFREVASRLTKRLAGGGTS